MLFNLFQNILYIFKYDIISFMFYFIILHLLYPMMLICIMCFSWRVMFYYVDVLFCCGKTNVLLRHIFNFFMFKYL